ncbi:hypothetical protein FACS189494_09490 [Spirochaetia bacterium]|nr:hypothetical protein FACS189494_09490 [Spirochaetia bacterium]
MSMPNAEFVVDSNRIQKIADAFHVELKSVSDIGAKYKSLNALMHSQYLAHITRAMEMKLRKVLKYDMFIIKCEPFREHIDKQSPSSAQYFPGHGQRFVIYYDETLSHRMRRNYIAHELGHLFLVALLDAAKKDKRKPTYEGTVEPLSSIFWSICRIR